LFTILLDDVAKINKDLGETKEILIKSIDQLLERGEKYKLQSLQLILTLSLGWTT